LASKLGKRSEFVQVDIHDASMLEEALWGQKTCTICLTPTCSPLNWLHYSTPLIFPGVDLVVHAAGPFQREDKCTVLEAAISTKVTCHAPCLMHTLSRTYLLWLMAFY
jgi:saccharopine dehydrogenase-like NADP-dependent oxidoreductase